MAKVDCVRGLPGGWEDEVEKREKPIGIKACTRTKTYFDHIALNSL